MEIVFSDEKTEVQCTDSNKQPFVPCNIDVIAQTVRIVEITEVSKHYE